MTATQTTMTCRCGEHFNAELNSERPSQVICPRCGKIHMLRGGPKFEPKSKPRAKAKAGSQADRNDPMPLRARCTSCGKKIKAKLKHAGKTGKCPRCRADVAIPWPDTPVKREPEAATHADDAGSATGLLLQVGEVTDDICDDLNLNLNLDEGLDDLELPEATERRPRRSFRGVDLPKVTLATWAARKFEPFIERRDEVMMFLQANPVALAGVRVGAALAVALTAWTCYHHLL